MKEIGIAIVIDENLESTVKWAVESGFSAICGGQRPLMRNSAAARRSLTATLVRRFR